MFGYFFNTQQEAETAQHQIYIAAGLDAPKKLTERWAVPEQTLDGRWFVPAHPDMTMNWELEEYIRPSEEEGE